MQPTAFALRPLPLTYAACALTCFAASPAAVAAPANPAPAAASSALVAPITQVTVYPGVAAVERVGRISVGSKQIVFECLPASIDQQSLQVSADRGVRIGDYKIQLQPRELAGKTCTSPLDSQIRSLEDQMATLVAEQAAAQLVSDYLKGVATPGDGDSKPTTSAQLTGTSEALRNTSRDNAVRAHQTRRHIELLNEQLKPMLVERERTGSVRSQVLKVTVQLASNTDANVQLNYQVRGPRWQPSYRATLDTSKPAVQLERQAIVTQNTGEDWSNVQLMLSTGQPTRNTQARVPAVWSVDLYIPQPVAPAPAYTAAAAAPVAAPAAMDGKMLAETAPELPQLDVSSINTAYRTQFAVPYKITVPSSSERITLALGSSNLPATLLTRTAPYIEEAAYLVAQIPAPEGVWPAGPVALLRDGALVGNDSVDFSNAQWLARGLSFGRDEQVLVRKLPDDNSTGSAGFIRSKTERTVVRRYAVTNRHSTAIALQVLDATPVARNDKVTVQSELTPQPATTRWNDQAGTVAWQQDLAAGASAEFSASHLIRYPQDANLSSSQ